MIIGYTSQRDIMQKNRIRLIIITLNRHHATKINFIALDKIVFIGYTISRDWLMKLIWAGRKTLVHRTAGNFPAIFIYMW